MKLCGYVLIVVLFAGVVRAQTLGTIADSVRVKYKIPEMAYAVVSGDSVIEMATIGVQRIHTSYSALPNDRFRIGSNTKAITGLIAALLVKKRLLTWNTRFFDVFPELNTHSKRAYRNVTLLQLLTFRTRLIPYTYTYPVPTPGQFIGSDSAQRYQFATWFFKQPPVTDKKEIHFSNLGYVAAGMMLEKVSGKPYKQLVDELGITIGVHFGFGAPNTTDTLQPWGHTAELQPEAPIKNVKLEWLLAAGNINLNIADYTKVIQFFLKALQGRNDMLTKKEAEFLMFCEPRFSVGWFWNVDTNGNSVVYNIGNPGTFLSRVYIVPSADKACILLTNVQSVDADNGLDEMYNQFLRMYCKP